MNYYVVDDNFAVIKSLEKIVESKKLGEVIGFNTDPGDAIIEIMKINRTYFYSGSTKLNIFD